MVSKSMSIGMFMLVIRFNRVLPRGKVVWPRLKMTFCGQNAFKIIVRRKNGVEKYVDRRVYVGHQI